MSQTVPFPSLPQWLPVEPENRPVSLRPFGSDLGDLAVEFAGVERPWLVTSLLARCSQTRGGSAPPERTIWELPVSTRIEALVALAVGNSARPLEWRVRCRYADCQADGELELAPAEIAALTSEANSDKLVPVTIGSRTAWLRRLTGGDQRQWLDTGADEVEPMAASLLVEPSLEDLRADGIALDEIGASIDRAMEEHDPLVGFRVDVGCAQCGRSTAHIPDLAASALERLWRAQFDLIEQVHRLASHYHWTEEEIAKIPAWRRHAYLACIDAGEL
jgi:hypothetical protein